MSGEEFGWQLEGGRDQAPTDLALGLPAAVEVPLAGRGLRVAGDLAITPPGTPWSLSCWARPPMPSALDLPL